MGYEECCLCVSVCTHIIMCACVHGTGVSDCESLANVISILSVHTIVLKCTEHMMPAYTLYIAILYCCALPQYDFSHIYYIYIRKHE